MNILDCNIVFLPKITFPEGSISVWDNNDALPFEVKRVFYLYDIPGGESRGAHAHKKCHQFIIAASGAFEVMVDDGKQKKVVQLNQPNYGLHIPPGIWASEINFSSGSICLVLTSENFDESDYIREYEEFLNYIKNDSSVS